MYIINRKLEFKRIESNAFFKIVSFHVFLFTFFYIALFISQWIVALLTFERRYEVVSKRNNYYKLIGNRNLDKETKRKMTLPVVEPGSQDTMFVALTHSAISHLPCKRDEVSLKYRLVIINKVSLYWSDTVWWVYIVNRKLEFKRIESNVFFKIVSFSCLPLHVFVLSTFYKSMDRRLIDIRETIWSRF